MPDSEDTSYGDYGPDPWLKENIGESPTEQDVLDYLKAHPNDEANVAVHLLNAQSDDDILRAIGINPDTTSKFLNKDSPTNKKILEDIGYTGDFSISDVGKFVKNAFTKKDGSLNIPAIGALFGAGAGLMSAGTATTKPTGYQGGIPTLTASQPMLTAPPTDRRAGSGGINYGTGVQYKDKDGKIVSDTSTSIADLLATAKANPYNQPNTYGNVVTPVAPTPFTFTPAPPHTSVAPPPPPPPPPPAGGNAGGNNTVVNNGIATGIDPNHPWLKASSDPAIKAIQNELEQLSHTSGTPEQRQAALVNFLHTTKDTPAQLAAASNGQWSVQDLIDQMQGNTNVFDAKTPWSIASTKADVKGVQDSLQKLSQTPGTAEEKQAALANFLKTTNYTPAQLAAASNGMWSVADLSRQMAGNPNLTAANTVDPSRPWATASSDQTIQGAQAALAKLNATTGTPAERQAALQNFLKTTTYTPAQLAAASNGQWGVNDLKTQMAGNSNLPEQGGPPGPDPENIGVQGYDVPNMRDPSPFDKTTSTPKQTAEINAILKSLGVGGTDSTPTTNTPAGGSNTPAAGSPTGGGFVTGGGGTSKADYDRAVATETARRNAEEAKLAAFNPDPNSILGKLYNNPSSIPHMYGETDVQAANRVKQQAMSETQLINNRGAQAAAYPNSEFVVTDPSGSVLGYGTPQSIDPAEQARLQAAHDAEIAKSMAGNQFTTGGGSPTPNTPSPFATGEPTAAPLTGLAALNAAAQTTYGRALTDSEQQDLSGKSLADAQSIMQQSMDNWNASHPKAMAQGGLTNLDHGGFVIPADVVSHFGNGSSSAGLELLAQNMGATPIKGDGDGMSDSIPAAIDGREKALVANDEAYLSPKMVERLGDGDMDAGSRKLKQMMEQIRKARTGSKEQGKQINPNNFMPGGTVGYAQGGGIKSYAGTDPTGSLVQAGVTGTEQNLSNWVGPYTTNMMGQAAALANTPYQAYTGPLTAGASGLQNLAFQNAGNLSVPSGVDYAGKQMAQIGDQAQKSSYDPATFGNQFQAPTPYQNTNFTSGTFDSGAAQQYMNPYLQQSLNPQLDEARRQSEITAQQNNAAMTKAGAFGGGRQAILTSENQRNLGTNQANITGQGYNTAYTNAMSQFNSDQARNMQAQQAAEQSKQFGANQGMTAAQMAAQYGLAGQQAGEQSRQFGANYGIQGLNTALQSAQGLGNLGIASGGLSLQNLNTQAGLGATQRGIESEGIAADKAQFEEARKDPYTKLQFQQSMLNGMPITATNYNMSTPSGFQSAAGGATTIAQLLKNLGIGT